MAVTTRLVLSVRIPTLPDAIELGWPSQHGNTHGTLPLVGEEINVVIVEDGSVYMGKVARRQWSLYVQPDSSPFDDELHCDIIVEGL
jgi:hypothetical protein